jgi:hypothetical protein
MWKRLNMKYTLFLSDLNKTWISSKNFRKNPKYRNSSKSVQQRIIILVLLFSVDKLLVDVFVPHCHIRLCFQDRCYMSCLNAWACIFISVYRRHFFCYFGNIQRMLVGLTRWFKYDWDYLCVNKSQFVAVIFEPPCTILNHEMLHTEGITNYVNYKILLT